MKKQITKYRIYVKCLSPIHIGNGSIDKESVLSNNVDDLPYIQGTSLSGLLRSITLKTFGEDDTRLLFGETGESKILVSDGKFDKNTIRYELRPRVSIDSKSGTTLVSDKKGSNVSVGHKFNTLAISSGACFTFEVFIKEDKEHDYAKKIENILSQCKNGLQQMGSFKTIGFGYVVFEKVLRKCFDLDNQDDLETWFNEPFIDEKNYEELKLDNCQMSKDISYTVTLTGEVDNLLLIKGIAPSNFSKGSADSQNIIDGNGQTIIPGSSLKGVIRNRIKAIGDYLKIDCLETNCFGKNSKLGKDKTMGDLYFSDTLITWGGDNTLTSNRIHIDKFTSSIMQGSLFVTEDVFGELEGCRIIVKNNNNSKQSLGVLIMALRDICEGIIALGGGYNVGKGFIKGDKLTIKDMANSTEAIIDFNTKQVLDENGIIADCISSLRKEGQKNEC